jgi:pre-mRNA 3'-end-processing factor FIP1
MHHGALGIHLEEHNIPDPQMQNEDEFMIAENESSTSAEFELVVEKEEKKEEKSEDMGNAQSIFEYDIENMTDKPWNKPGADITDYFNYGFNETTWGEYCNMQKRKNEFAPAHSDWSYSGVRRGFHEMGRDEERKDRMRRDDQMRAYDERREGRQNIRKEDWHGGARHGYRDDRGEKRGRGYAERGDGKRHGHWEGTRNR